MFYQEVIDALIAYEVDYALVGGVAVALHGVPRMTFDVDITARLDTANLQRLDAALVSLGLRCRLPIALASAADPAVRADWEGRNLIAVTYSDPNRPLREVDVLIGGPVFPDDIVAHADSRQVQGRTLQLASIATLIRMKESTGRQQDSADVIHLRRVQESQ